MKYRIKSIFGNTIQGEGSASGMVVKFIRFAGCNRWSGLPEHKPAAICKFCDTDFRGGEQLEIEQIIERLDKLGPGQRVVISGGEPTLQLDEPILLALKDMGFILHLETNGSRALGKLARYFTHITMSPKQSLHDTKLEWCTDLKILFPPIHPDVEPGNFSTFPAIHRFLQPVWDDNYKENLKLTLAKIMAEPAWRLSLQMHKILGVE